jgi:signal recognition particle subunit SRP19
MLSEPSPMLAATMSYQARIEEIASDEESDVSVSDPSEGDISEFDNAPLRPAQPRAPQVQNPDLIDPRNIPQGQGITEKTAYLGKNDVNQYAHYQSLYPVYFDSTKSRVEGRRVKKSLAVENPLARTIVDATQQLGLRVVFEPGKMHPKDWANPGRVRVLIKNEGKPVHPKIKNSMFTVLYNTILTL